jgi:hypothetical protein
MRMIQNLALFFLALFVLDCHLAEVETRRAEVSAVIDAERSAVLDAKDAAQKRLASQEVELFIAHNCTETPRDSANVLVRKDAIDAYAEYSLSMVPFGESDSAWIVGFCD